MRIHGLMPLVSYSGCCRELAKALADARASVGCEISEAIADARASVGGRIAKRLMTRLHWCRPQAPAPTPCEVHRTAALRNPGARMASVTAG